MCQNTQQCCSTPDECKAYMDIEEQIGHCTPDQAWGMYFVSTGSVRENIRRAVMKHIAQGNKALLVEFPELAPAKKGDHESG
ncbi:hypothetical protein [Pseudomonas amygdali]|uniref:Uncharacterized protein n=3 Tax=Pseudomonas TaxID=286 RepID=A0A3M5MN10_PSESX|nr:hypothetical protein [Pseudomonas amygdali]PPS24247.1 hypothetical protein BVY12_30085 [Pseudomonas amygdali pv. morsprunorum]RMS17374.1 hypothetical protein ALP70_02335 [Pseudomonas savastanoi]RMT61698.1 hypothetical protein ALP44_02578 [Pseudomonas syringae pv. theae]KWT18821.1 hypothetical protein AL042_28580 [Pseudomonas amygdali pv. aesculi]KWT19176.1 hypothetical protein AL044_04100 [Pseudomonas amygdali pv. aesculi]